MKWSRLAMLMAVATLPLTSLGQNEKPSEAREAASPAPTSRPERDVNEYKERRPLRPGGRSIEQEFPAALEFFKIHSKERGAAWDSLEAGKKDEFKPILVSRYEAIKSLEKTNPELYKLKLKQLALEDQRFLLKRKLRSLQPGTSEWRALRNEIQSVVGDLVRSRVQERKLRINRIQELLKAEQDNLAKFESRQEEMIRSETQRVLRDDAEGLTPRELRESQGAPRRERDKDTEVQ